MTSVLITGGTGFIGSRLALRCLEMGESVRVLAQRRTEAEAENADTLAAAGVEILDGSVTDAQSATRACEGIDVVYHLAAAQHEANVPDRHFHDVNVEGTRTMLDASAAAGVRRFVHGSTIGVYGEPSRGPVTEDTPLEPDNIYGVTKLEGERLAEAQRDRLPVAIVRISETYGPGDRRLLKLFRALGRGRFVRIGAGRNLHHLVYIDDLVEGLRVAAESAGALSGVFVLAGPRAISTDEMISRVAEALGVHPPRLRVPLWPLTIAATVLEATLRPLGIQPPLHRRRMSFFLKSFRFDMEPASKELGWRPTIDFPEGAARTAAWYDAHGLLANTAA